MATPEDKLFEARELSADPACEVTLPALTPDADPQVDTPNCDPIPEVSPDTFSLPARPPLAAVAPSTLPKAINLSCRLISYSCPAPSINLLGPATITIAKGRVTADFFLDDVSAIPGTDLLRMEGLVDALQTFLDAQLHEASAVTDADNDFIGGIASLLDVSTTLAAIIATSIIEAQTDLDDAALTLAQAGTSCGYRSVAVWAKCDETEPAGYALLTSAPAVVDGNVSAAPIGAAVSAVSQEDANERAGRIAAAELQCVYGNTAQTASCAAIDQKYTTPFNYPELTSPNETLASLAVKSSNVVFGPGGERLVASVTTAANSFTASSLAAANVIAMTAAQAQLNCFFPSRKLVSVCSKGADKSVTIAAGSFIGDSLAEADTQAVTEAAVLSVDVCVWGNRRMTYACDDIDDNPDKPAQVAKHLDPDLNDPAQVAQHIDPVYPGVTVMANKVGRAVAFASLPSVTTLFASVTKSLYSYTALPGEITGESQEEADALAAAYAQSQLSCVYCNPRIEPVCRLGSPKEGEVEVLPISGGDTTVALTTDRWSTSATAGVPGVRYDAAGNPNADDLTGTPKIFICSADPSEVVAVADSFALLPVAALTAEGDPCKFTNKITTVTCANLSSTWDDYFSDRSSPSTVTVPAGTVEASTAEDADALARVLALSQLNCFFESPALEILCGATSSSVLPAAINFVSAQSAHKLGDGKVGTDFVHADANGSTALRIQIPYGTALSFTSPTDAYRQALLLGLSQLDCFFKNKKTIVKCEIDISDQLAPGAIPSHELGEGKAPNSYVSQTDADNLAKLLAESYLRCLFINKIQESEACASGLIQIGGTVARGTIVSTVSARDADIVAKALADALKQCLSADQLGSDGQDGENGTDGAPGPAGPAGNCATPCTGFYA